MEGWRATTIGAVCEVIAGQSPKSTFYNSEGEGLPFYQGKKEFGEKFINPPATWTTQITREAAANDILMSVRAPVGPINFATERICIGRGLAAIRATDEVDRDFLFYSLLFLQPEIQGSEGAVFASINKRQIQSLPISLPPLPTQRRIVAILDEAFAAIDRAIGNVERNLGNVGELWESYLESVIHSSHDTWKVAPVGELGLVQTGSTPRTNDKANFGGYIPFIKPADFTPDGSLDYSNSGLSEQGLKGSRLVKADSVLMVCIGATIGKAGFTEVDVTTNQQINALTPGSTVLPKFVYFQMLSRRFQDAVVSQAGQATLPIINKSKWSKLPIHFPESINEQQSIVTDLEFLAARRDQVRFIYESKLNYLHTLKQSLLHQAFTGRLTSEREVEEEV